jgi:hypothetical protein
MPKNIEASRRTVSPGRAMDAERGISEISIDSDSFALFGHSSFECS